MTRIVVGPDEVDFDAPGRRDYWVTLEHDTMWGAYLVPLTVLVGPETREGRGLVAFGSTHGNEYEGPTAIKQFLREVQTDRVLGRLIFIPVLNPAAFRAGTRDSVGADGVNLNRAFVDGAGRQSSLAGITHRLADLVRRLVWPHVHVVLDLHSGGNQMRFDLCSSFHPIDDADQARAIAETARWFGSPLVMIYQNRTPGLLTSEAERLGKITVGTELGWGEAVNSEGVQYARQGILAAAVRHGQLAGEVRPAGHHAAGTQKCAAIVDAGCYVPAPFDGVYEEVVSCGARVRRGEVVGRLHDFQRIDEPAWDAIAPLDGIVVAQAWSARVRHGQFIVCVGEERPW